MHEELGKEVRINLENEAKIKHLECRQARYEENIQYLYGIIEKLESQRAYDNKELHSLKTNYNSLHTRLRKSERVSSEKEKFILFRESQLSGLEDTIFKLRQQNKKMASSSSTKGVVAGFCENIRESLAVLYSDEVKDLTPEQLKNVADNITTHQGQIDIYSENLEIECARANILRQQAEKDLEECIEKKNTYKVALREAQEKARVEYESLKGVKEDIVKEQQAEIFRLRTSMDGLVKELDGLKEEMIDNEDRWAMGYDEFLNRQLITANEKIEEYRDGLVNMIGESERLEENCTLLANELQRNLDRARQDIADKDYELDLCKLRIRNFKDEKAFLSVHYRAEQTVNRSLVRQRLALKIANRQLQIRLMNPPIIIPPPPPTNQTIWLLL